MATGDIRDRSYKGTETFGEAFERLSKGTGEYEEAIRRLREELGRMNDLTDIQETQLEDWLKSLDEIRDSWEEINDFIENDLKNIDDFRKNLEGIRGLFTNILRDLQPARRQATEQVALLRNFRDLTGEIQRATVVQNGTSEANLNNLSKRVQKTKEQYEWTVRNLTADRSLDTEAIRKAREREQAAVESLEQERKDIDNRVKNLQEKLKKNTTVGDQRWSIKAELNEALAAQKEFNKSKAAELDLHRANVEILQEETKEAINYATQRTINLRAKGRDIRRSSAGLGIASRIAEKFGVAGARDDYEDYVQRRINGVTGGGAALLGGWIRQALTLSGILAAVGLTVTNIWRAFRDVSSEIAKLQQNIGKFRYEIAAANTEFASSRQYLETANELVQQFGQNPISFIGQDEIAKLAEAKNLLGLSAEQAGNVGIRSRIAGQSIDQYNESIVEGINRGNALNRSTVAHGAAMREVLATTDDITLSLGNSGEQLGRAIVAAKNLGMSLKDVDNIANQLLNFESSIENEMKAQLLTGNQMNLSRARALALQNDLDGLARELTKQNIDAVKFSQMNRIQQESVASALGMSREQLGKMLVTQAGLSQLTNEQVKAATGVKKEQLEAMGISER